MKERAAHDRDNLEVDEMKTTESIALQILTVFNEGGWTGVSVRGLFHGLSFLAAAAHPIPGAHCAWEILLHLGCWHDVARRRIAGEAADPAPEEDWPAPAEATEANWRSALEQSDRRHTALVEAIRALDPRMLGERAPGQDFTIDAMLHGVPQHDLYHGGQVMMLIKALHAGASAPA